MKIYLAARYGDMQRMRDVARLLRSKGCIITAQWILGAETEKETKAQAAQMDIDDVIAADVLLFFAQPEGSDNKGGGRHFEFGYAYALGKPCVVIGEKEHIFCHLANVKVYATLDAALDALS